MSPEAARVRVPAYVAGTRSTFRYCPHCDRVFWRATHVAGMRARLEALGLGGAGSGAAGDGNDGDAVD
jgi:uncharacterized protein with PIN domain